MATGSASGWHSRLQDRGIVPGMAPTGNRSRGNSRWRHFPQGGDVGTMTSALRGLTDDPAVVPQEILLKPAPSNCLPTAETICAPYSARRCFKTSSWIKVAACQQSVDDMNLNTGLGLSTRRSPMSAQGDSVSVGHAIVE